MGKIYTIKADEEQIREIEKDLGVNLLERLKEKGAVIEETDEEAKTRFIVLNKGAHPIEESIKKQFPNSEIIILSHGNLDINQIQKTALEAGKIYRKGDILVLTGPSLLVALSVLYIHAKTPDEIKLAQYDLKEKIYKIFTFTHLELREKLSETLQS